MKKRILCVWFLIVLMLCNNSVCVFATETTENGEDSFEESLMDEISYPFQSFADKSIPGISVEGSVDEGVFPSGTTMSVIQVSSDKKEQIKEAINMSFNGNKKAVELIALEISFFNSDEIINPKDGKTIQLVIHSDSFVEEKEYLVVCFKDENSIEIIPSTETIITNAASTETTSTGMSIIEEDVSNYKKEISFEIKEASVYAIIETEDVTSSTDVDNTEIDQNEVEKTETPVDQSEEEADTAVSEKAEDSNETSNNQDAEVDNETLIDKNEADSENTSDSHDKSEETETPVEQKKAETLDEQKKMEKSENSTEQKGTKKSEKSTEQNETKKSETSTKQNTEKENDYSSSKNEKTKVSVNIIWDDSDNNDRVRPESVSIKLFANGEKVKETYISENDDWKRTFENLPKFQDGKEIVYTIKQKKIKGYETEINDFDVTNKHDPETIMVEGSIMWDDSSNKDGIRPEIVTVSLTGDGTTTRTTASRDTGWKYSLGSFPKYESGKEIEYIIEENPIEGYEPNYYGFNITNVHKAGTVDKSDSESHSNSENKVKGNNIWLWIVVMISCVIIFLIIIKRKNNKD